ncbi:patatin-like phospholipase family protein [Parvibium lacunae]|uniref:Patatin-like phospholipase family protein n=1 Tax=Parvibium lacunae TaxID=1888893 RepID=A0A368L897_9BURK|nr:patatin-like phospholipase family protein [Parvibium lacunae]RCS59885.1 patatin-like phospholipase family protein [Parvibium lacunae]
MFYAPLLRASKFSLFCFACLIIAACQSPNTPVQAPPSTPPKPTATIERPIKIGLALGGGAARGFAHIGVIKALEAQGIIPDIVVGTSAGSVVGALYAGGYSGFELQKIALQMEESEIGDWTLSLRGILRGEALQNFINKAVQQRPLEKLSKPFAAVATDLKTGEMVIFERGNTGMAVRASSAVPGVFQPVMIQGREYVDGGLTSPVPVRAARKLGADFVIAVDISSKPQYAETGGSLANLLQTFTIMGQSISQYELADADLVLRPNLRSAGTDFNARHTNILEGEKATQQALNELRQKLQAKRQRP